VTELDREGRDELHYAAMNNDVDTVTQRLDAGVDVNLVERRAHYTPLHFAVQKGAVDAAKALLDAGADLEARDSRQATPLHLAVTKWRQSPDGSMIRLLLDRGATVDARETNGWTVSEMAQGQFEFPDELREMLRS
jgi:ankyrin repeat protein